MFLFVERVEIWLIMCFGMKGTQPAITCSKLTIKILEQSVKYVQSSGVFIVNFEYILHLVLVFLLLTLTH